MKKWTIKTNGELHGTYPNEKYAKMAWAGLFQTRPKNSYRCEMINPQGDVVQSGNTPTKGSSFGGTAKKK